MCGRGGVGEKPFQGGRRGAGIDIEGCSAVAMSRAYAGESARVKVATEEISFRGVDEWSVHCILN